jgi:hypothetical protein
MGLDQYLYASKGLSDGEWRTETERQNFAQIVEAVGMEKAMSKAGFPFISIDFQVGYWRKENAIHQWFVDNCQDGVDDCRKSYVSREKLQELRSICERVLLDNSLADELLPTQSGFFFGSTEYDDWYFNGLRDTVDIINHCLVEVDADCSFFYQSSW